MIKRLNKFILGNRNGTYGEIRKTLLVGYYIIISLSAGSIYFLVYALLGYYNTLPWLFLVFAILSLSFFLNQKGKRNLAVIILFPLINLAIYLFASSEPYTSASFLLFPITVFAAFVLFGSKEVIKPLVFAIFTFMLFIASYWVDFSILPYRDFSPSTAKIYLFLNFSVLILVTSLIIHILNQINAHQEGEILEKNLQLSKTNSELDRFVYSASHDLRAPLSSVMGLLYIAKHSKSTEEIKFYLNLMDQRIKSLEKFIKDITEYSRNNRVAVHEEVVVVHDLVHEVWESLRYGPEADQITLECNFERTLSVRTDRERIKIILSNLISNALRYHDLEKTNRYVKVNAYSKDKSFILEIEDNGQGIEDEHKSRVFDMFFRANEKSIGSGLGLYIVKEALEKISGIIQVNSRIKEGSVFTIRLPFKVS